MKCSGWLLVRSESRSYIPPMVGVFAKVLQLPRWVLMPTVVALSCVGVYAVNASALDLVLMTILGLVGYGMRKTGFPLAPVILGLVLGPLMEKSLRRALALSGGEWSILFDSPIAIVLWILAAVSLLSPLTQLPRLTTPGIVEASPA